MEFGVRPDEPKHEEILAETGINRRVEGRVTATVMVQSHRSNGKFNITLVSISIYTKMNWGLRHHR